MDFKKGITIYLDRLKKSIDTIPVEELNNLMNLLHTARNEGRQVLIMGNGGSAATASHVVCDFNKSLSYNKSKRFKFICLNDNIPTLMAYGNDVSYDDIFVEPLKNFLNEGDLVIGLSGSGNSKNVIKAFEYANKYNAVTIALTGYDGGKLKQLAKHNIHIPINDMQIVEDLHTVLNHCMMKILHDHID
ncbi:MAG: SIS domain-containing protein [Bacteroidales bacterium]|nr:SIS domain-containing protein [Bacteroidales bacterium]